MYANVAVNAPVDATFDYHLPPELIGKIAPGHLVQVEFRTAMEPAIVLSLSETSAIPRTKPVIARLDPEPVVTEAQIALSRWLAAHTLAALNTCLWLWLPPGLTGHHEIIVSLLPDANRAAVQTPLEREIVALLTERGELRGKQLTHLLAGEAWRPAVETLVKDGVLSKESILTPPRVRPRVLQVAALAIHPSTIESAVEALPVRPLTKVKFIRILNVLARSSETQEALDVSWVYAQTDSAAPDLKKLEAAGLIRLGERGEWRDSTAGWTFAPVLPPRLTPEQATAWQVIQAAQNDSDPEGARAFLLHGVTGSGKTEIYLRAIAHALERGQSALFLVPEIALTPQTARRVAARFAGKTAMMHSALSDGERYDTWRRAREGDVRVVVGARSALFTPLQNLGLIILDEEHDNSYKQSPPITPPHYHARDVAERIMRMNRGVLILGSATPSVETMYRAGRGELVKLELPRRIMGHRARIQELSERAGVLARYRPDDADEALMIDLPPVQMVDMRAELKAGNTSIFSRDLMASLKGVLRQREQAILFLNRRGESTYVFCRDCGYVAKCPRCDTPLTFHRVGAALRCHRCAYEVPSPETCPKCGSKRIKFFGAGTQQVEAALIKAFPQVRVARWDSDTAANHSAHEAIWQRFVDRRVDVMIGTQMIAKGLDLPLVTLVGVISADVGLNLPDFRARERTFQLMTQVAGRAGRGVLGGRVIMQTYQPDDPALVAASTHDYAGFYEGEIAARRAMGYPPFRRFVRILFRFSSEAAAQAEAERAAELLRRNITERELSATELIGPAPCFFMREGGMYRWHVLLRGPDPVRALEGIPTRRGWFVDIDPVEVL